MIVTITSCAPGIDFEDTGNGAPEQAAYDSGDEGQGQVDEDGQAFEVDATATAKTEPITNWPDAPMLKRLTLKARATESPVRDEGDGFANGPGPTLAVAESALKQTSVGSHWVIAGKDHNDGAGEQGGQECERGDEERA